MKASIYLRQLFLGFALLGLANLASASDLITKCGELLTKVTSSADAPSRARNEQELRTFLDSQGPQLYEDFVPYLNNGVNGLFRWMNHGGRDHLEKDLAMLRQAILHSPPHLRAHLEHLEDQVYRFLFKTAFASELQGQPKPENNLNDDSPERWGRQFSNDLVWRIKFRQAIIAESLTQLQSAFQQATSGKAQKDILSAMQALARSDADFAATQVGGFILNIIRTSKDSDVIREAASVFFEHSPGREQRIISLISILGEKIANPFAYGLVASLRQDFRPQTPSQVQEFRAWRQKVLEAAKAGRFDSSKVDTQNLFYAFITFRDAGETSELNDLKIIAEKSKSANVRGYAITAIIGILTRHAPAEIASYVPFFVDRLKAESALASTGRAFFKATSSVVGALAETKAEGRSAVPVLIELLNLQIADKQETRIVVSAIAAIAGDASAKQAHEELKRKLGQSIRLKPQDFKFAPITVSQLKAKIQSVWKKHEYYDADAHLPPFKSLTSQLEADLSAVEFDTENMSHEDPYGEGLAPIGYETLDNGMTFLGINAGGDWEEPIFFIVYWDGTDLRGYIPESGNPWNTDTKKAYGNDDDNDSALDRKNVKKRYPEFFKDTPEAQINMRDPRIGFNEKKILEEIKAKFHQ